MLHYVQAKKSAGFLPPHYPKNRGNMLRSAAGFSGADMEQKNIFDFVKFLVAKLKYLCYSMFVIICKQISQGGFLK